MFDIDGDGYIGVPEFLSAMRIGLNPRRRAFVERAFQRFDQNGDGQLTADEVRAAFNASAHPDVARGIRSAEEVLAEFVLDFDCDGDPDGVISKQEFEAYYSGVSAGVANDEEFVDQMCATWGLDDSTPASYDRRPHSHLSIEEKEWEVERIIAASKGEAVVNKVRALVELKLPLKVHQLSRELRKYDPAKTGYVSYDALDSVIQGCLLHYSVTPAEVNLMKETYDTRRQQLFDYLSFLNAITGDLPPRKLLMVEKTWRRMPTDKQGNVTLKTLHAQFQPDCVPDVAYGVRSAGQVLSDFMDCWDAGQYPTQKVCFHEFQVYYHTESARVPEDAHFETMMKMAWRVWEQDRENLLASLGE